MSDLPNYAPLTIDEVIAAGDLIVRDATGSTDARLSAWVGAEKKRRAQLQEEYEASPVEVAGVTLNPGDVATITIKGGARATRRMINCLFVRQRVAPRPYGGPVRVFDFRRYGAADKGYGPNRDEPITAGQIMAIEKVEPIPEWIEAIERDRKARGR